MLRRDVLKAGFGTAAMAGFTACSGSDPSNGASPATSASELEEAEPDEQSFALMAADANGLMLPAGFASKVLARSGRTVDGSDHVWHSDPDGGAVFGSEMGWTYVSNSEAIPGGVGALDFDDDGQVVGARELNHPPTVRNCAGGATPWGTWLTCEEWEGGRVLECDPTGTSEAVERLALGTFTHEAVAVDPDGRALYLTEDQSDGGLYRFVPDLWGDLSAGTLEIASLDGDTVSWTAVPRPNPALGDQPTRKQVGGSATFDGGEGTVYDDGHLYFTTKGDDRVWDLETATMTLRVIYHADSAATPNLSGVDNITIADGSLYVAEDGGNMELVLLSSDGRSVPCLRIVDQSESEITGPAFDPSGTRLYFSSQRGTDGNGITYEVTGRFAELRSWFAGAGST